MAVRHIFYVYPDPGLQQPWDPDYAGGFGYYDWLPRTLSLRYDNHSGNRHPGRAPTPGNGGLDVGSVTLFWSSAF